MSLLLSCSNGGVTPTPAAVTPVTPATPPIWVTAWNASPENASLSASNPAGSEQTFRFFFVPTIGGTQERLRFNNTFGSTAITIGAARLAIAGAPSTDPAVDPTHDAAVTFSGSSSIVLQPGASVTSDSLNLTYTVGQRMAVTMYVQGSFPPLTVHDAQVETNYQTAAGGGNTTTDAKGTSMSQATPAWFLLGGMDVYGSYQGTVVLFGSSTVDGHASNYASTNLYPVANTPVAGQDQDRPSDWLGRQLASAGYSLGVANAGILGDAAGPDPAASAASNAQPGTQRFARDVLSLPNVKAVIVYLGSVDLRGGSCVSAPDVESSLTDIVSQANAAGIRIILSTVPPASFCSSTTSANAGPVPTTSSPYAGDINPGPENPGNTQRGLLNAWIRTSGAALPGVVGIADLEKALQSPDHPDFLLPNINSGDNFHPTGTGYGMQSAAIPLTNILAK